MKLNVPNIISFFRVIITPFFFYFLVWGKENYIELAIILYLLASVSDFFDGWAARKYGEVSNFGKFFDPLADKILVTAAFLAFVLLQILELWMVLIVVLRDLATTFLRYYADKLGFSLRTSLSAKWKTFLQMVFVNYLLLLILFSSSNSTLTQYLGLNVVEIKILLNSDINYYIMLFLVLASIWTLVEYFYDNRKNFY